MALKIFHDEVRVGIVIVVRKLIFVLLVTYLPILKLGCTKAIGEPAPSSQSKEMVIDTGLSTAAFLVEIADTEKKRQQGLMERTALPPNHGMLFIFDRMSRHSFWMKNTFIPLDLIFFDDKFFVVGTIENAEALSLANLAINEKSRYVLEVIAGTVKKYGIAPGMRAHLSSE